LRREHWLSLERSNSSYARLVAIEFVINTTYPALPTILNN
jgi:hypothetical protein